MAQLKINLQTLWWALMAIGCLYHMVDLSREYFKFRTQVDLLIEGPIDQIHVSYPPVAFLICYRDIDNFDTATLLEMSKGGMDGYLARTDDFTVEQLHERLIQWDNWMQIKREREGTIDEYYQSSQWILCLFQTYLSTRWPNETGIVREFWGKMKHDAHSNPRKGAAGLDPLLYLVDFTWNELNEQESDDYLTEALANYTLRHGVLQVSSESSLSKVVSTYAGKKFSYAGNTGFHLTRGAFWV